MVNQTLLRHGAQAGLQAGRYRQLSAGCPSCTKTAKVVSFVDQYRNEQSLDERSRTKFDMMRKRHFIRGWASFIMFERCFWPPNSWLRTADSDAVHHIERVLSETEIERHHGVQTRATHDWRALTAYLLSEATPQDIQDKSMGAIASKAASEVISLLHP
ncbi:uncharacterized protein CC84DRAFT_1177162 [Paraphaeosphaeria sporulosa]|uniref:Uncharacterized protein n=1 Tax=Paraphaeosphaeria sporulosa TaxID=1460663 RepID=A0A177CE88_9PLEO|nr:uncharacterized protein CC84DRAFT_1177162 [Paraphaeosphaeria sporulosa]OAG05050.1 hypothetical protein CC84DRAFT_1177162 [Paraphaeosphaeria sporulosa]